MLSDGLTGWLGIEGTHVRTRGSGCRGGNVGFSGKQYKIVSQSAHFEYICLSRYRRLYARNLKTEKSRIFDKTVGDFDAIVSADDGAVNKNLYVQAEHSRRNAPILCWQFKCLLTAANDVVLAIWVLNSFWNS